MRGDGAVEWFTVLGEDLYFLTEEAQGSEHQVRYYLDPDAKLDGAHRVEKLLPVDVCGVALGLGPCTLLSLALAFAVGHSLGMV